MLWPEKYLRYFSDYDPVKKVKMGQLYMKQGKTEDAYEKLEDVVFSTYNYIKFDFWHHDHPSS